MNRAPWSTSGLYNDLVIHLFSYHHQFNCHNTGERRDQENEEWSSFTDKPLQDSSFFDFRPSTVFEAVNKSLSFCRVNTQRYKIWAKQRCG
ncbi:hypothetical protein POUND7_004236 [Theobroma cacao]